LAESGLATSRVMAFVATSDAARARTFYADVLGLAFVSDVQYALVFDSNGTMLRIQKTDEVHPAPYTALGWQVDDIVATVRQLSQRGAVFERYGFMEQDEHGIWTTPDGSKVAWFKDPDGNTLSLTQFAHATP
jgi:catechol 2,3-dioxygenase-like lactoylglutathione lyase family enzyme